jgi:hypothetical protein
LGRPAGEKVNPHPPGAKLTGDPKSELELPSLHPALPLLAPRMTKQVENRPVFINQRVEIQKFENLVTKNCQKSRAI